MFDAAGVAKICDFGFAKKIQPLSLVSLLAIDACDVPRFASSPCGTPGFVAPEVLQHTGYDCSVDLWALGVITFMVLYGMPPFSDIENPSTPPEERPPPLANPLVGVTLENDSPATRRCQTLLRSSMAGKFIFPATPEVSKTAEHLITDLLQVDPMSRLTAVQVLSEARLPLPTLRVLPPHASPHTSLTSASRPPHAPPHAHPMPTPPHQPRLAVAAVASSHTPRVRPTCPLRCLPKCCGAMCASPPTRRRWRDAKSPPRWVHD